MAILEDVLPALREGKRIRNIRWPVGRYFELSECGRVLDQDGVHDSALTEIEWLWEGWEIVPEPTRVADYLVPLIHPDNKRDWFVKETHPIGQQPEGSVMVPGSEKEVTE